VEERVLTRASGFDISGFSVTRNSRQEKSRNPETRRSHSHSISVEDRCHPYRVSGLGRVCERVQNRNRYDFPIRDFPITTGVWAIGAIARGQVSEGQALQ
jgi:hypothetical protein